MGLTWWLSIGAGALVMGVHAAFRVLTHRFALHCSTRRTFLLAELGGLGARMMIAFVGVALGLACPPVREDVFVGTVLVLLVLSMGIETYTTFRRMDAETLRQ